MESGTVAFEWDQDALYLIADLQDTDIQSRSTGDGQLHFLLGDVIELFLWPASSPWYWEFHGTPAGYQTSFFFPSRHSRDITTCNATHDMRIGVTPLIRGTLNNPSDLDSGFRVEIEVPVRELTRHGDAWGPGSEWRVLVGRYNYTGEQPAPELSSFPALSRTDFHLLQEYAWLRFC